MKKAGLQSIALFKTFYNTKMLVYGVLQIVKRLHRKTLKTFYLHMIQRYNCANLAIRSAVGYRHIYYSCIQNTILLFMFLSIFLSKIVCFNSR